MENTDIELRVNEIENLLQEDLKEAAKRTIDFAKEFYPADRNRSRTEVEISSKLNLYEKTFKESKEIVEHSEKLIGMILDLIYDALPKVA
ncbi:MAG: hypothetical protein ACRESZ_10730 [Methylococcales bacterium]